MPGIAMSSATITISTVESLGTRLFGGKAEVQAVTRIVLDDQQSALGAGYRTDGRQHGIDTRRGEDLAGYGRREHALADEACMRGLMTGPAAGDDCNLRFIPVRAQDHLDLGEGIQTGKTTGAACQEQTVQGFSNDGFPAIEEMLHGMRPVF